MLEFIRKKVNTSCELDGTKHTLPNQMPIPALLVFLKINFLFDT